MPDKDVDFAIFRWIIKHRMALMKLPTLDMRLGYLVAKATEDPACPIPNSWSEATLAEELKKTLLQGPGRGSRIGG